MQFERQNKRVLNDSPQQVMED